MPDIIPRRQSQLALRCLCISSIPALLAYRTGNVIVLPAITRLARPTEDQRFRGAGFRGIGVEAVSLFEALALTEFIAPNLAGRRPRAHNPPSQPPPHLP